MILIQLTQNGIKTHYETVLADLQERDNRDMNRTVAPLKATPDSITIDTSHMTAQQVLQTAIGHANGVFDRS